MERFLRPFSKSNLGAGVGEDDETGDRDCGMGDISTQSSMERAETNDSFLFTDDALLIFLEFDLRFGGSGKSSYAVSND